MAGACYGATLPTDLFYDSCNGALQLIAADTIGLLQLMMALGILCI